MKIIIQNVIWKNRKLLVWSMHGIANMEVFTHCIFWLCNCKSFLPWNASHKAIVVITWIAGQLVAMYVFFSYRFMWNFMNFMHIHTLSLYSCIIYSFVVKSSDFSDISMKFIVHTHSFMFTFTLCLIFLCTICGYLYIHAYTHSYTCTL